jgi:hypothetical protein
MSRFHDPAGALRPASLSLAGLAIAAVAVVAIAATGPGRPAAAAPSNAPAPTTAAVVPTPVPTPVSTPTPTPVVTPAPTASPDEGGSDAMPITVELDTFDGHAVTIDIVDGTGSVVSAVSGRPGDGASAGGGEIAVANVDARTLHLTWVDFPIDNRLALFVDEVDGHIRLLLVQPGPAEVTDAIGFDRQLILVFDRPIDAGTVVTVIQEGLDTPA